MVSLIRLIRGIFSFTSFAFGTLLNSILVFLILKHTSKTMQVYSKILLQTCVNDLALLFVNLLYDGYMFVGDGGVEIWADGLLNLLSPNNPGLRGVQWLLFALWCWLVYQSLFGFVAQFIYRYLTLNRNKTVSTRQYFAMYAGIAVVPLVYCVLLAYSYIPPPDHQFLKDQAVAELLDVKNVTAEHLVLSGYNNGGGFMTFAFWYIMVACTLAYAVIIVLGWRMMAFVRANLKLVSSNTQSRTLQRQKQITLTLIIQAILPTFIYASLFVTLLGLVFNVSFSGFGETVLQYYYNLTLIPMYFPSALNPIVSIAVIQDYRRAFRSLLRCRRPDKTESSNMPGGVTTVVRPVNPRDNNNTNNFPPKSIIKNVGQSSSSANLSQNRKGQNPPEPPRVATVASNMAASLNQSSYNGPVLVARGRSGGGEINPPRTIPYT